MADASRPRDGHPEADDNPTTHPHDTATLGLRTRPHRVGQGGLFDAPDVLVVPLAVRERDPQTSVVAAKAARARGKRSRLRGDLLRLLQVHGSATDDELQQWLPDDHPGTVSKTRLALVREGLVRDTGHTRETRRGIPAQVWELVR